MKLFIMTYILLLITAIPNAAAQNESVTYDNNSCNANCKDKHYEHYVNNIINYTDSQIRNEDYERLRFIAEKSANDINNYKVDT